MRVHVVVLIFHRVFRIIQSFKSITTWDMLGLFSEEGFVHDIANSRALQTERELYSPQRLGSTILVRSPPLSTNAAHSVMWGFSRAWSITCWFVIISSNTIPKLYTSSSQPIDLFYNIYKTRRWSRFLFFFPVLCTIWLLILFFCVFGILLRDFFLG